jgi:hypothetical protein
MKSNQNSSRKFSICSKLDLNRSKSCSYRKITSHQNRVIKSQITAEAQDEASKAMRKPTAIKIEQKDFLLPHNHFIKQLIDDTGKPP